MTKDNAKFNIVLATGVVVKNKKILIAQRSFEEVQAPGKWSLPGGKVEVEKNEENVIEKTIQKEVKEEVNVEIFEKMEFLIDGAFVRVDGSPVVTLAFLCKWKSGKPIPLEDSINVAWVTKHNYENYDYAEGIKGVLSKAFAKIEY